jgi:hypothetical protein
MEVAPPPPPSVDVPQQDWATDVPDAPASEGGSTPPPAPTWEAAPAAFASAPEVPSPPAPEPAPAAAPAGSAGGLTRRVPGASLSESPLGASAPAPEPAHDRSADGVRSMLSSFQTGRHRGRAGADAHDEAAPVGVDTLDPAVTQHTGAQAPELEDPRDH